MTLQQLRYFVTIGRTGSFRVAASELSVSQPTLSQQISALERELGTELFNRDGPHISLTPLGERVLRFAQIALQYEQAIIREALAARHRQELRIGSVLVGITSILPTALAQFRKTFNDVHVSVHHAGSLEIAKGLEKGQLDFGLVGDSTVMSLGTVLVKRAVASGKLLLCVPGRFGAGPDDLSDRLSDSAFIMLPESFLLHHVAKLFLDRYSCRTTIHTYSIQAAADLVVQAVGVSILPDWLIPTDRVDARYHTLPLVLGSEEPVPWEFELVWNCDRVLNAADEAMISAIADASSRGNLFRRELPASLPAVMPNGY